MNTWDYVLDSFKYRRQFDTLLHAKKYICFLNQINYTEQQKLNVKTEIIEID